MSTTYAYLIFLATVISYSEAYKILVIFPLPARSHSILGNGIVRHLLNGGHEVTYISPYPYKTTSSNFRLIDVSSNAKVLPTDVMNFETILKKESRIGDQSMFMPVIINLMNFTIHNEEVQKILIDPKEQFDLVIVEWLFTDVISGFAAVYNCPYIWVSSLDIHWVILKLIDQPSNPAYSADIMSPNMPPFNFWQRVKELYTQIKGQYLRYMYFNNMERRVYEDSLAPFVEKRGRKAPSYPDVQYNASLVLANSHVSLGQAVSIPHNYISVGGYHIDEDVEPLPENIKQIMDNAKYGVIYFSMGSNLKSKDMPKVIKDSFLKVFGELKQTVLWKFEENLPDTPKNVQILNWAPQQSILAHPNTVLFISHGGLLSTTETIHFGIPITGIPVYGDQFINVARAVKKAHPNTVLFISHGGLLSTTETIHFGIPIIGIPVYGDQFINVARAVKKGFAYKVELSYDMADDLKKAIEEVMTNPKYAKTAKELSFIYHDRRIAPGKEIQHWVRHVIETRGALHLRSPAFKVPFYQNVYIDLIVIVLASLFTVIKVLKCVCNKYCSVKNVSKEKKTN